jgi:hypothetical protein
VAFDLNHNTGLSVQANSAAIGQKRALSLNNGVPRSCHSASVLRFTHEVPRSPNAGSHSQKRVARIESRYAFESLLRSQLIQAL